MFSTRAGSALATKHGMNGHGLAPKRATGTPTRSTSTVTATTTSRSSITTTSTASASPPLPSSKHARSPSNIQKVKMKREESTTTTSGIVTSSTANGGRMTQLFQNITETVKTLSPAFARMVTTETMDVLTEAEECEEEEHDYETEEEDDNSVPETVLLHPHWKPGSLMQPQMNEHYGRMTVVLDMDETLLHSEFMSANEYRQAEKRKNVKGRKPDFTLRLATGDGEEIVHVHKRPGVEKFLENCCKHFEVVVFTAALPVYAKPVMDMLDPKGIIKYRFYRDSTITYLGENFVKDVGLFGRDMGRTVLIDNNPHAMIPQPDNAFPILSWFDDDNDNELEKAFYLLQQMQKLQDFRPYLKNQFDFRVHMSHILESEKSSEDDDDDFYYTDSEEVSSDTD